MQRPPLARRFPTRHDGTGEVSLVQSFRLRDLVSLSVSSVGPMFSVAATGGVMAAQAGWWTVPTIVVIAIPFIISGFVFRLLNRHFPHSGASYHWSARVIGRRASRFQAWILIVAYFASIPPIIIPAASYTLSLLAPHFRPGAATDLLVSGFWVLFAAVPLLGGGRPTARITQAFLALEILSLAALAIAGAIRWPAISVPVHFGAPPIRGMLIVAVVAATILDGWEIDSYASEESRRPRSDPGVGGIAGALAALGFYAVLYPLMLGETPLGLLAGSTNPLAAWGDRLVPGAPWLILIPIIGSTAGGLWLTSFILTRALYAMGREGLVPARLAKLSRRRVPATAIVAVLGAAFAVTALQTLFSSLSSFFALVLSAAGFFLVAEFFLDTLTASVFLARNHHQASEIGLSWHRHGLMQAASVLACTMFATLIVGFFVFGPSAIGGPIDAVIGVLVAMGVVFSWLTRHAEETYLFAGDDCPELSALARPPEAGVPAPAASGYQTPHPRQVQR